MDVNGTADFVFSLFDVPTGGAALAAVAVDNVTVQDGLFTVELPLNSSLFDSTPRWLEILVRSPAGSRVLHLAFRPPAARFGPVGAVRPYGGPGDGSHLGRQCDARRNGDDGQSMATFATTADTADTATFATSAGTADTADLATAATRLDAPDGSPTSAVFVSNNGDVASARWATS